MHVYGCACLRPRLRLRPTLSRHLRLSLNVLDTAVGLQLLAGALPVEGALDELVDDGDNVVDLADELGGGVALAEGDGAVLEGWMSVLLQRELSGDGNALAKSTVQPKGVPSSSLRAYFLPMDAPESSTRDAMPNLRSLRARGKH